MCSSSCRALRPLYGASIVQTLNRPISCRARYRHLRPRGSIRRLSARALAARLFNTRVYRRPPIVAYALLSRFAVRPSVSPSVSLSPSVSPSIGCQWGRPSRSRRPSRRPSVSRSRSRSRRPSFRPSVCFPSDGHRITRSERIFNPKNYCFSIWIYCLTIWIYCFSIFFYRIKIYLKFGTYFQVKDVLCKMGTLSQNAQKHKAEYDQKYHKDHYEKITIAVDKDKMIKSRLETLSISTKKSKNQLILQAIEKLLEDNDL